MRIVAYARPSMPWQVRAADEFQKGLQAHGLDCERRHPDHPVDCDLAVMWSNRYKEVQRRQRHSGRRFLIMERGYLGDRENWVSIGYDGLNGYADFCNQNVPSDRWEKNWKHRLQRARSPLEGSYVLVIGQVPGDESLTDYAGDPRELFTSMAEKARSEFGTRVPVYFRPHPLCITRGSTWGPEGFHRQPDSTPLQAALSNATAVVTWSSTTGVESVMAGVPTIALSKGSMVADIAQNTMTMKKIDGRNEWGRKIAYAQWTYDEISNGTAWDHLKVGITT